MGQLGHFLGRFGARPLIWSAAFANGKRAAQAGCGKIPLQRPPFGFPVQTGVEQREYQILSGDQDDSTMTYRLLCTDIVVPLTRTAGMSHCVTVQLTVGQFGETWHCHSNASAPLFCTPF